MNKLLTSIMSLGITLFLLGNGTFAYFSDVVNSNDNIFTAGTVSISIGGGGLSLPFQFSNILPGESDEEIEQLSNNGNINVDVYIISNNFSEPVEPNEPNGGIGVNGLEVGPLDFSDIIDLELSYSTSETGPWTSIYDGSLRDLDTRPNYVSVNPSQIIYFKFEASLPTDLNDDDNNYEDTPGGIPSNGGNEEDNAYQADGVVCSFVFTAIQQ